MNLTAKVIPWSSVLGTGLMLIAENGRWRLPAKPEEGQMRRRGKRHDGGISHECPYCGEVGARVVVGGKRGAIIYGHRRCIGPAKKPDMTLGEILEAAISPRNKRRK